MIGGRVYMYVLYNIHVIPTRATSNYEIIPYLLYNLFIDSFNEFVFFFLPCKNNNVPSIRITQKNITQSNPVYY